MEVQKEILPDSKVQLKIKLDNKDTKDDLKQAYRRVASKYNFPGFRKGKAPDSIIDARLGKEEVFEEMLKLSLPRFYIQALKETDTHAVTHPKFEVDELDVEKGVTYTATVTVSPEVKLGNYKKVVVEVPKLSVEDEEIDAQIDQLRTKYSSLEKVERKLKEGDYALIDYTVEVEGKPLDNLGSQNYLMEVSAGKIHEELRKEMIGAKAGGTVTAEIALDEDYPEQSLAGKNATFKVNVKEIKERVLPELKDEFVQDMSRFDTVDELKKDIKERIEKQKESTRDLLVRRSVVDKVLENSSVEVPSDMLEDQVEHMVSQFEESLKQQGKDVGEYLLSIGSSPEALKENYNEQSLVMLQRDLVLQAIADKEEIEVKPEDLQEDLEHYARASQQSVDEVRSSLEKSGRLHDMEHAARTEKTLDFLLEHAEIKESKEMGKNKKAANTKAKIEDK